jgi:predicted P-loop ATPase
MSDIRFLTAPGSFYTLIDKPGQAYPGISWAEIARMAASPQAKEKIDADFFIPSTYREHDGRSHDAQREHGAFRMLALDIDRGNPSLDDVLAAVEAVCGPVSLLAYSSSGASPENRKWRVLLPLAGVLTGAEYEAAQTALFDLLHANGIHPDGALARCGQPIYLPNVPLAKRNPDITPIFYQHRVIRAGTLRLDAGSAIRQEIDRRAEQHRLAAEQAERARADRERQRAERRQKFPDQVSPVDAFNADHSIEDLLMRYQYERRGSSQHYRSRYQTSPSFATENFLSHWVSLSGSDAAAGVGKPKSLGENAYCWGDAFDLFCHYEHDGDFDKAVRAYGQELRPNALMGVKRSDPPSIDDPDDFDMVQSNVSSVQAISLTSGDDPYKPAFAMDSKGNIPFNHHNAMEIITKSEEWRNIFAFDEFAQRKMVMERIPGTKGTFTPREIRDSDYISVLRWFNQNGFLRANKNTICDAVDAACMESIISPVKHWLERMGEKAEQNPQPREYLDTWAVAMLGVEPQSDQHASYVYEVSRKWLISCVARAMRPGCKADAVLILEGSQGAGKSTALRILAGDEWFGDALPQMGTKDASDYLRGKWIVELAELSNINKAEVEIVKAFVSRSEERFRPAYGRSEICYPRQCIFAGTTNKSDYLRDETGNRRFWPIKCGTINTAMLEREREMLWGEAVMAFKEGEQWWLNGEAETYARHEQEKRLAVDEWTSIVENYCAQKDEVAISQIASEALSIEPKDINRQNQNRISTVLSSIGFVRDGKFSTGEMRNKARFVRELKNED